LTYTILAGVLVAAALVAVIHWATQRYQARVPENPSRPYAKIIADSITEAGYRLTTMEVRFHRFVLAEFNTHSMFVRNSASSRAIPVKKMIAMVREDPAIPLRWPSEQSGMQGGDTLTDKQIARARRNWLVMARVAADFAAVLAKIGVHKSITNRILEPFMWHTVVVTSSKWENFFEQRISPLAQREIAVPAEMMQDALKNSTPVLTKEGAVHAPYMDEETLAEIDKDMQDADFEELLNTVAQVSAARCARVSYLTQDGKRDYKADLRLFYRLVDANPKHWSPLAHVATPCADNVQAVPLIGHNLFGSKLQIGTGHLAKVGQFPGWLSLRHIEETHEGVVTAR